MILAGIDIGTNTLRLLIAETSPGSLREIHSDRRITRLGQGLDRTGALAREAEERSLKVLSDFADSIRRHAALHTAAIGTSALRNASNSREFIKHVKRKTGLDIHVVTGGEEARLTLLGVAHSLKATDGGRGDPLKSSLVIDIGGGSTEIIITRPDGKPVIESLPLGAVYLTERFLKNDPPSREDVALSRSAIRDELAKKGRGMQPASSCAFIGTAGTITTLAAMDQGLAEYDSERINRSVLARKSIDDIVEKLSRMTLEERKSIRGLEPGREDIILAGALVTQEIMGWFGFTSMLVSDWGLREGIVLDLFEKLSRQHPAASQQDP